MKNATLVFVGFVFATVGFAQSITPDVIASSGAHFTNFNAQLSFTVGEVIIETVSSVNSAITQGFHQPEDSLTGMEANLPGTMEVYVFPNPFQSRLTIQMQHNRIPMTLELYDLTGKLLYTQKIQANKSTVELNLASFSSSGYLIRLVSGDGRYHTSYIIQKTN